MTLVIFFVKTSPVRFNKELGFKEKNRRGKNENAIVNGDNAGL